MPELAHKKTADMDGRARSKWRGFSPGTAARHSQQDRARPEYFTKHLFFQFFRIAPALAPVAGSNLLEKRVSILGTSSQNSEFLEPFQRMSK